MDFLEGAGESHVRTLKWLQDSSQVHILTMDRTCDSSKSKWQITDTSLLRWRRKLQQAAQECDETLHRWKQRILEDEQTEKEVSKSKFPKRIAHTAKSFVSSIFSANKDESNNSVVQRFEWFADGASDFLRLVELGGTPRRHMPFDPLIRHLLAGKKLHHRIIQADKCLLILLWIPFITAEHGIEGSLLFMQKDRNLSESTDIVGVAAKCLQLFHPLFKSTVENIRKKLLQLPTQDLPWVPYVESHQKERWDNLHSFGTRWFRPNPLCCKLGDLHCIRCSSKADIVKSQYNRQTTLVSKGRISLQDPPRLKAGLLFMPHGPSERSAAEVIHGDKQSCLDTNITLQHLEEIILPKAVDYFDQNAEASVYQILWKWHCIHPVMVDIRKENSCKERIKKQENSRNVIPHFLELWVAHAPVWLQSSIMYWIQKSKDKELAPYKNGKIDQMENGIQKLRGDVEKWSTNNEKKQSNANRNLKRLEMAHIKLEATLGTSEKWQITDASLLCWRRKLKRVALECDDTLHKCKQRILEDKQVEHEVQNSSLLNRIVHTTKSFVSSIFNSNDNGLSRPIVQRFEWYADGASEFLRFIELGGTPHRHMPFNSITRNLLYGKELYHKIFRGKEYPLLQLWLSPHHTADHGTEAALVFIKKDGTAPEGNIHFSMMVQLSESTDIVGIAAKSLRLFAPYVKCAVENIINELTHLPAQDFSWYQKEHLYNLHSLGSQWYRPNPLCCKQRGRPEAQFYSNNQDMAGSSDASMEPLVGFNLQWQVSLPVHIKQKIRKGYWTSLNPKMAEIVGSAVVQETVSQVISNLLLKYEEKEESNANRNLERLEMAHIRLEAALETSDKWQITDASLLRWRRKLKRAAQECDDTLHKCKQRILEDKQVEHEVQNSSLPNRIIHATKSFVSSIFNRNDNGSIRPIVQRFEWYADGASEFLRFIELGGTPHRHMPFNSITRNLLSGKELYHKIFRGNEYPLLQLWLLPKRISEHGIEANLVFIKKDIYFGMVVQLSESTDIFGIAVKSLQLFALHVKCTVENIRNDLTQLPTQDFSWVPSDYSYQKEHWDNLHSIGSQWFRPNPLCCKRHDQHQVQRFSNLLDMSALSDVSIEPLVRISLRSQVSLCAYSKQKTSLTEEIISLQDSPCLRAGLTFAPHGSSEDMLPVNNSSVTTAIVGGKQHLLHTDINLEQLEETMLPKAIDHFCQNAEATVYQMIWKSKHGFALIEFEKPSMRTWRTFRGAKKRKLLQGQDQDLIRTVGHIVSHSIGLWVIHVPVWLQRSFMNWMQKEKEIQFASPQLQLKLQGILKILEF
ncbi:LOW QUALITY PROTEIN: hypothetical protein U9M48_011508 [Paspalum notatum var. saurae]|uniref:Uncharacterized protein n=1 Tax=Paspalum notatum var. saurae TaxID=547442 RepID=A0AAQ3SVW0_PASNO